jgi:hypothetical protein
MAWVVETEDRSVRRNLLWGLLRAELRQFWWLQPAVLAAGLGVWTLLEVVTARVSTDARPEGVIFNYVASLVLSVFPVLLAGPLMTGLGSNSRLGLLLGLPVSRRKVNLLRILGPVISVWPIILTWPLIMSLLHRVYGPVSTWAVVNSVLLVGLGIILSLRTSLAAFIVFLLLPLQVALAEFIPGGRSLAAAWAGNFASPWMGAALLAAGAGLLVYGLNTHPPRK